MALPQGAHIQASSHGRDWDSQTIGDSDPFGHNHLGEKTIEQTEKATSSAQEKTDEFFEGGTEGWKVVLGCALIAGPSIDGSEALLRYLLRIT
ncbi:unnamed protein product [Rhizoctonia solani]|uniref:Uncharacterized protein n=1 Tax=Rhizoctonia solani TaxID=456999 RepID=A0A8H3AXI8_9AGAM|nr:unnamed protein product [Rhizoctonia solani]